VNTLAARADFRRSGRAALDLFVQRLRLFIGFNVMHGSEGGATTAAVATAE
jgi:hypothetical protein